MNFFYLLPFNKPTLQKDSKLQMETLLLFITEPQLAQIRMPRVDQTT